jgi:lactoylglutathione lyase
MACQVPGASLTFGMGRGVWGILQWGRGCRTGGDKLAFRRLLGCVIRGVGLLGWDLAMKLGYTIIYVADVLETVAFYERAFGLERRFVDPEAMYGEMATGETVLAFAVEAMADVNGVVVRPNRAAEVAAGFEIAFVSEDPAGAYDAAVAAGAVAVKAPEVKPWGQSVAYVRDLNGCLVEICSPMG